jgi:hypothetical protein
MRLARPVPKQANTIKNTTGNVCINLILRRVRVTIFVVERQELLHILSVCLYPNNPARKARAPYYIVICGLSGPTIFFHIISYTVRFSGNVIQNVF